MSQETDDTKKETPPSAREGLNRLGGLSSYALGIVLVGVFLFMFFEDGVKGVQKDVGSFAIVVVMILICFGIGYTTSRKKL